MSGRRTGRTYRLRRRADIERLFDQGRRGGDRLMMLYIAPNGLDYSRLAVGVSARHGKAVRRNRIKRLCREAFRLARAELPSGYDYMMLPRVAAGARLNVEVLQSSLKTLAGDLAGCPPPRRRRNGS